MGSFPMAIYLHEQSAVNSVHFPYFRYKTKLGSYTDSYDNVEVIRALELAISFESVCPNCVIVSYDILSLTFNDWKKSIYK